MNIIEMLVPEAYVFANSNGYQRKFLVLHKTAGGSSAQATAQYFQNGAPQADGTFAYTSVHYVVGLDGVIVRCVREQDAAGGNCCLEMGHDTFWPTSVNLNWVTFSIECVDPALDNSTPMPTAQKQSLFWLTKDLCTRQDIPMRPADSSGGIAGHSSIDPQSRAHCPGNFAWDELWAYLGNGGTMGIPSGWSDNGSVLTAPKAPDGKQYTVTQGFRAKILEGWDANNVPLENAHGAPGQPGTSQTFLDTELAWTPDRGVYIAPVGQHLLAARSQITALQAEITVLQSAQPAQIAAITSDLQAIATATQDALGKLKA